MQWCSLVQAKLWLWTTTKNNKNNSIEIMGPLASSKERQNYVYSISNWIWPIIFDIPLCINSHDHELYILVNSWKYFSVKKLLLYKRKLILKLHACGTRAEALLKFFTKWVWLSIYFDIFSNTLPHMFFWQNLTTLPLFKKNITSTCSTNFE